MQQNDKHKPIKISRLLSDVFENKKWSSKLELHRVFEFWDSTVGKEIAAVAQPSLIRSRSVLCVKVRDSIWMQQLHLQKMLLIAKINRQLNGEQISDIHFQLDSSLASPTEPQTQKTKPILPDRKKEMEFDNLLRCLENDALKTSLKNLWITMHNKGK
jgi:predicted nucleic acid-binding Zn ribbon protein